jgi:hypothetical protein
MVEPSRSSIQSRRSGHPERRHEIQTVPADRSRPVYEFPLTGFQDIIRDRWQAEMIFRY